MKQSGHVVVRNTQKQIPIDIQQVIRDCDRLRALVGYPNFGLHVWITTDQTVRNYNKQYRHIDKTTDILSFPYWPDLLAGQKIKVHDPEDQELGDLIISAPYVARAAQELGVTFDKRLQRLLVHGICHLLGYDHIVDADWRRMRAKEGYLLKRLQEQD
jgi:probable rRNA maturation factor